MKSVLVVEDDAMDAELFCTAAREVDLADRVLLARDGKDALRQLRVLKPTVIFLDLSMPGIDGFEVLRRIKGERELRSIPVHVLSTSNSRDDVERAYSIGASAYVQKPDSFLELKTTLAAIRRFWDRCELP